MSKIDANTAVLIEEWFVEGDRACMRGDALDSCPYTTGDKLARHWWTRGYAYQARLMCALGKDRP